MPASAHGLLALPVCASGSSEPPADPQPCEARVGRARWRDAARLARGGAPGCPRRPSSSRVSRFTSAANACSCAACEAVAVRWGTSVSVRARAAPHAPARQPPESEHFPAAASGTGRARGRRHTPPRRQRVVGRVTTGRRTVSCCTSSSRASSCATIITSHGEGPRAQARARGREEGGRNRRSRLQDRSRASQARVCSCCDPSCAGQRAVPPSPTSRLL